MFTINFQDWRKNRSKKEKEQFHEIRIFELIFSRKITELGLKMDDIEMITILCLANDKIELSYEIQAQNELVVAVPYNFQFFMSLNSVEEKFHEFEKLVRLYILPMLNKFVNLSKDSILEMVNISIEQIVSQDYEAVFLVGKTPKKSPSRKKTAILRGIHRVDGFRLYCEVFDAKGMRILNKLLVKEIGSEQVYSRFLGELRWENEFSIVVKSLSSSWKSEIEV